MTIVLVALLGLARRAGRALRRRRRHPLRADARARPRPDPAARRGHVAARDPADRARRHVAPAAVRQRRPAGCRARSASPRSSASRGACCVAESLPEAALRRLFGVLLVVTAGADRLAGAARIVNTSGDEPSTKTSGSRSSTSRSARSSRSSRPTHPEIDRLVASPHTDPRVPHVRLHPRRHPARPAARRARRPEYDGTETWIEALLRDPKHRAGRRGRAARGRRGGRRRPALRGRRADRPGRRRARALPRVRAQAARLAREPRRGEASGPGRIRGRCAASSSCCRSSPCSPSALPARRGRRTRAGRRRDRLGDQDLVPRPATPRPRPSSVAARRDPGRRRRVRLPGRRLDRLGAVDDGRARRPTSSGTPPRTPRASSPASRSSAARSPPTPSPRAPRPAPATRAPAATSNGSGVTNLKVDGQPVTGTTRAARRLGPADDRRPGRRPQRARRREGYRGFVTELDIHLTADHGGLPANSEIQIGYAEAAAQTAPPARAAGDDARRRPTRLRRRRRRAAPSATRRATARSRRREDRRSGPLTIQPKLTAGHYVFPVYGPTSYIDTFGAGARRRHLPPRRRHLRPARPAARRVRRRHGLLRRLEQDRRQPALDPRRAGEPVLLRAPLRVLDRGDERRARARPARWSGSWATPATRKGRRTTCTSRCTRSRCSTSATTAPSTRRRTSTPGSHQQDLPFPIAAGWAPGVPGGAGGAGARRDPARHDRHLDRRRARPGVARARADAAEAVSADADARADASPRRRATSVAARTLARAPPFVLATE